MSLNLRTDIADPLWVPLLTHYTTSGAVDAARMLQHRHSLTPHVRQVMLAGSTGDGWELDDSQFDSLIDLGDSTDLPEGASLLFGILRPTTDEVVARLRHLESRLDDAPRLKSRLRGVAICPPVEETDDQARIREHFETAFAQSRLPVAVYQLPQVTRCILAPDTLAALSQNPRVIMFKDSSGEDLVARDRSDYDGVVMVRGAEGGYLDALKPSGPYDGWLLSTGNALAAPLRRVLELNASGNEKGAARLSDAISAAVEKVFAAAQQEGGANAFSNANRAMDFLRAHGADWRTAPPALKVDGSPLSSDLIAEAQIHAADLLEISGAGYRHL
ncbi:dihydrodipicolinate synthase family protein [Jiella marina]|uniref:dihydrodipicolinate synthase family protein n=1 Tax=Jiella sp. LLJ827 TaxID=2917712 RepID=UPI002101B9AB|nr:dihydrodipicolinate synthase family protein [Jiella sp. LLJ827]MCQ0986044.1 dihydrodipicolinate synthase family protein [Jiella sp. LLJ827]